MTTQQVPLDQVIENPWNTRPLDQTHVSQLADSIREQGLLQPPAGRLLETGQVQLALGHHRLAAFRLLDEGFGIMLGNAGQVSPWATIPVEIRELTDLQMALAAITENERRKELTAIQKAQALDRLIKEFKLSQTKAGEPFGMSQSAVANLLGLLKLPPNVQAHVADGTLPERFARQLTKVSQVFPKQVSELADALAAKDPSERESTFPWMLDDTLRGRTNSLSNATWLMEWPAEPIPFKGKSISELRDCAGCAWHLQNRGNHYCLTTECFEAKGTEHSRIQADKIAKKLGIKVQEPGEAISDLLTQYSDEERAQAALSTRHESLRIVATQSSNNWEIGHIRKAVLGSDRHTLATTDLKALSKAIAALPAQPKKADPKPPAWKAEQTKRAAERKVLVQRAQVAFDAALPAFTQILPANMPGAEGLVELVLYALRVENVLGDKDFAGYRNGTSEAKRQALARLLVDQAIMHGPKSIYSAQELPHMIKEIQALAKNLNAKLPAGWDAAVAAPKAAAKPAAKKAAKKKGK